MWKHGRLFMFGEPDYMEDVKKKVCEIAAAVTFEVIDVLKREGIL